MPYTTGSIEVTSLRGLWFHVPLKCCLCVMELLQPPHCCVAAASLAELLVGSGQGETGRKPEVDWEEMGVAGLVLADPGTVGPVGSTSVGFWRSLFLCE